MLRFNSKIKNYFYLIIKDKQHNETDEDHLERKAKMHEWRWILYDKTYEKPESWAKFNRIFDVVIVLNSLIFMLHFDRMPDSWFQFLKWSNNILIIIFFIEISIKIFLFRSIFFQKLWNNFEIFLLITALIAFIW